MSDIGRVVFYHGSIPEAHGYYTITRRDNSGYILTPEPNWDERPMLFRVRDQSITVVQFAS